MIDSRSKLEGIRPLFFMSRDTKALVTFVITMVAVWVSNIVYKIGYNIGYWNLPDLVDSDVSGHTFGIFLAFVIILFPTYKLTKKYLWNK